MSKYHITQKEFEELLKKAKPDADSCFFPKCENETRLTIQKDNKAYGVCAFHWGAIARSNVEWRQKAKD